MAESVPVRCPACRREHSFIPPTFPCPCGTALIVPLLRGGIPMEVRHRTWDDSWVTMRCSSCGRSDEWPRPELGCSCGATVRLPVDVSRCGGHSTVSVEARPPSAPPLPGLRPPFHPVTIRSAADTVTAAARYLKWLGFTEVGLSDDRPSSGLDVRGHGVVAKVCGDVKSAVLRDVECLWLNSAIEEVTGVCFALAGYARDARARAEQLAVPLFTLDLTGTPQPVNGAADVLALKGAPTTQ